MTTPTPMRELIERATPGLWKATGETVVAPCSPGGWKLVCHMSEHITAGNDCALIARCSPDVLALVLDALELAEERVVELSMWAKVPAEGQTLTAIRSSISALNGQPPA